MEKDYLTLERAPLTRLSREWKDDDYDVLADGEIVGRIFNAGVSVARPWMWTLDIGYHELRAASAPAASSPTQRADAPDLEIPHADAALVGGQGNRTASWRHHAQGGKRLRRALVALALKFFARPLSFSRAVLISLIASLAGLGLPQVRVELPATFVILFVGGYLITKLAQKYGIKKTVGLVSVLSRCWHLLDELGGGRSVCPHWTAISIRG